MLRHTYTTFRRASRIPRRCGLRGCVVLSSHMTIPHFILNSIPFLEHGKLLFHPHVYSPPTPIPTPNRHAYLNSSPTIMLTPKSYHPYFAL